MTIHKLNSLSCLTFSPLESNPRILKATINFPNSYGCNIYKNSPSTNREFPYEFEVIKNGKQYIYTPLSDDNIGYCSEQDVLLYIDQIKSLQ